MSEYAESYNLDQNGPTTGDAFGAALIACSKIESADAIVGFSERDDGLLTPTTVSRYFEVDEWEREFLAAIRVNGPVLDVGSGAGRHIQLFQNRSDALVALDPSRLALQLCKDRIPECACVEGVLDEGTVKRLGEEYGGFALILLLGNNLGLLGWQAEAPETVRLLGRALLPGGVIVGSTSAAPAVLSEVNRQHAEKNRLMGRSLRDVTTRFRYGNLATRWYNYSYYDETDLYRLFEDNGFTVNDLSFNGRRILVSAHLKDNDAAR